MVRTQLGWLDKNAIVIPCGKCKILIRGYLYLDQENAGYKFEYTNADEIFEDDPHWDYYIEASGELLTKKLAEFSPSFKVEDFSPFLRNKSMMGDDGYVHFAQRTIAFLRKIKMEWARICRANELWISGSLDFIGKELSTLLPIKMRMAPRNNLDCLLGIRYINQAFFKLIYDDNRVGQCNTLFSTIDALYKTNPSQINDLATYFENNNYLKDIEKRIFRCLSQFVKKYPLLIPVWSLIFFQNIPDNLFTEYGITTISFEDIKDMYQDIYEVASDLLILINAYH
jgi:hypothetical protein